MGEVYGVLAGAADAEVLDVFHHTDDPAPHRVFRIIEVHALSDRVPVGEEALGEGLVDNDDARRLEVIRRRKAATGDELDAHGVEVSRRHPPDPGRRLLAGARRGSTLDLEVGIAVEAQ